MNIALISLFLSILLSGCEAFGIFIMYPLVSTYKSITNDEIEIRGSCPNPSEGQAGVRIVELDEPGLFSFPNDFTQRISISRGQHVIGIKLGHISKIQKLTLQFSSKHRYLLSATFNKSTNKYQTHFWDESKYPAKKLASFEFEATPDEIGQEKLEEFNCNSDR